MYVLYADSRATLKANSQIFDRYMEPMLQAMERAKQAGRIPANLPEISQYLQVCRWPFRQLEYSFALDALLQHLKPGMRYLDSGSGATPLAHVISQLGVEAEACDSDAQLIAALRQLQPETIYGTRVQYSTQDLTATSYPDESFDAISCISVLEHIPAPHDQRALCELQRILKPGGILVMTVDFTPVSTMYERAAYFAQRAVQLIRRGDLLAIVHGLGRKVAARQVVSAGVAQQARSANQCFEISHIEQDLLPALHTQEEPSRLPFTTNMRAITPSDTKRFWDLAAGLYHNQGQRAVLPAAFIGRKIGTIEMPTA
ncbi:MAG: class I SAM-dependent methyltransferase [Chloroflexales bacterium]